MTGEPDGLAPVAPPPMLRIVVDASSLAIRGAVSSAAHEEILRETAARLFAGRNPVFEVEVQPALPPGWSLVTDTTLRALAAMRMATAEIDGSTVSIRGMTTSTATWEGAAARISRSLLPGMRLRREVVEVEPEESFNRQCAELFRNALRGRGIGFATASAEIGTSAFPLLDELVQIATDCPAAIITVKGHTDDSGNETTNRLLSQARADAVSAYLAARGISPGRIVAAGVGSAEPLIDGDNPQAQRRNRRIDMDISFR